MIFRKEALESFMTGRTQPPFPVKILLALLSGAYGAGVCFRRYAYASGLLKSRKLPCFVISIGNLTTGGTGKTPMALYVAEKVRQLGYRVAVISRGYRGTAEKSGGIVSDGISIRMDPVAAGDEPFLMAASLKGIPVLVGQNRYLSGVKAIRRFETQVVILDDAFQHLALFRNLNLLLLDSVLPFGNGQLLPRGTLREPASALRFSDALILTRCPEPSLILSEPWTRGRPVFCAIHNPFISIRFSAGETLGFQSRRTPSAGEDVFRGKRCFAFSGIARNADFQNTLRKLGADICGFLEFTDHHAYSAGDIRAISQIAVDAGATLIATTEKDLARLHGRFQLALECVVVGIRLSFDNSMPFDRLLQNRISLGS